MDETVTITTKRYNELLAAEWRLTALESGGVDNWDWYGDSIIDFEDGTATLEEWTENRTGEDV